MKARKKVIVEAMGKNIIIENPDNINMVFKQPGARTFMFKIKVNRKSAVGLEKAFKKLGERSR